MAAPEIMTAEEVAEMLRCSVAHVQRQAKRDLIPGAVKLGHLWRFKRTAIEQWFDLSSRTKEETL